VKRRFPIPNILAIAAGLLMVQGMRLPWWILSFFTTEHSYIYPYIIRGPAVEVIGYRRSPQMQILTYVLIAAIVLVFLGSLLSRWKGRIVLAAGGGLALLGVWRFLRRIADVASSYDMPIEGTGVARYSGFDIMDVSAKLAQGIYLMVAGVALCFLAALLHTWLHRPAKR
jgi:hypothetical protein